MPRQDTPEYVLYLRKSKGRMGISRQRAITTAHVESLGGRVVAEFPDTDRTAFRHVGREQPKRDGFNEMLAMLRARPGLRLAAWHADRLTRNDRDTTDLIETCATGGHIVETPRGGTYDLSTATGRKRLRADALDAIYEVDHNTERVAAAKAEHAAEGRWLGGRRPFGWTVDTEARDSDGARVKGVLVLCEPEAQALAAAHRDILDGKSLYAIAREWNAVGIRTSTGARWRPAEVRRVLQRPMNAAPPPAQWPAVIDAETHRKVIALLARPERKITSGPERRHLLSGIAACGTCGRPLVCSTAGSGRGPRTVYRCRQGEPGHVARDRGSLEAYITAVIIERLSREGARELLREDTASQLPVLELELSVVREAMRESNDLRRRKLLSAEEFAADRAEHLEQMKDIEARIAIAEQADAVGPFLHDPAAAWEDADLAQRRTLVAALMAITIEPTPKGRPKGWRPGRTYFDPESVRIEWKRG